MIRQRSCLIDSTYQASEKVKVMPVKLCVSERRKRRHDHDKMLLVSDKPTAGTHSLTSISRLRNQRNPISFTIHNTTLYFHSKITRKKKLLKYTEMRCGRVIRENVERKKNANNILHANCYSTHNKNRLYYVLPSGSIVHREKKSLSRDTSTQLSSGENIVSNLHWEN
jgi:hypothetical protein